MADNSCGGESSSCFCKICIEDKLPYQMFNNNRKCHHSFCKDCIAKYIDVKIHENCVKIKCPDSRCSATLEPEFCKMTVDKHIFEKWENLHSQSTVVASENVNITSERADKMMVELAKSKRWMRCPSCKFYVERTDGCPHISCRCGFQFCYGCGSAWKSGHSCLNKPRVYLPRPSHGPAKVDNRVFPRLGPSSKQVHKVMPRPGSRAGQAHRMMPRLGSSPKQAHRVMPTHGLSSKQGHRVMPRLYNVAF